MTNPIKTFYYMEISVPNAGDIIGFMRLMLDQHIAETDAKYSKIAKEFVFSQVKVHNKVDDTQAITLEFMNKRQYDTYMTAIAPFREWVKENYGVEYSYEKISSTDMTAARGFVQNDADAVLTYYDQMKEYMLETLPEARGFA